MIFTLTLETAEVDLLGAALGELPLKVSQPLFQKIAQQVAAQQTPKLEAVPNDAAA